MYTSWRNSRDFEYELRHEDDPDFGNLEKKKKSLINLKITNGEKDES